MLFNSLEFIIFLPVVFACYWLLRKRLRWQNTFVVAASYLFYGWWDWRFLLLIAFTSFCSYFSGIAIHHAQNRASSSPSRHPSAKFFLWANTILNLLILGLFKYYDFFAQSFADLFLGGQSDSLLLHLVLPVGISFYTFQALSYSIDIYRGALQPTRNCIAFLAYVSFFPQLVAGPIERATSLLPQFEQPRRFSYPLAVDGLRQMLWGFFKKMVVADSCGLYVNPIFEHPDWYNGSTLFLAAVLFSIQIYGDFSGYSDIAIGCAKLFGIRLRRNFNVPYFSRDIAEFWRRWHISLTTWFRDYIYIPLGGSRVPKGRIVVSTFIIFLLPSLLELLQMLATFLLTVMGWILFRADSISDAFHYFSHMFSSLFDGSPNITSPIDAWVLTVSILVMTMVEWINRDQEHEFRLQPRVRSLRWAFYVVLLFSIGAYMVTNEMPFIYFQF